MDEQTHETPAQTASAAESEHAGDAGAHAPTAVQDVPFDRSELTQFDNDDSLAGRAIGKLLSSFFLYTVIAMALVAWWTFTKSQ